MNDLTEEGPQMLRTIRGDFREPQQDGTLKGSTSEIAEPSPNSISRDGRAAANSKSHEAGMPPWLHRPSTFESADQDEH